jgi:hypothetical protein
VSDGTYASLSSALAWTLVKGRNIRNFPCIRNKRLKTLVNTKPSLFCAFNWNWNFFRRRSAGIAPPSDHANGIYLPEVYPSSIPSPTFPSPLPPILSSSISPLSIQTHSQPLTPGQSKYGNDRTIFRPHIPQPPRHKTNEAITNPHRRPKKLPSTGCCMSLFPPLHSLSPKGIP